MEADISLGEARDEVTRLAAEMGSILNGEDDRMGGVLKRRKRSVEQNRRSGAKRIKRFPTHLNPITRGYKFLEKNGDY